MTTNDEMRAAQRAASALWDDYCQAHDVACPDGCDVCCHGHFVPVWAPEVPLLEEAIRRLPERNCPVMLRAHRETAAVVPEATISPPRTPGPGPKSIT